MRPVAEGLVARTTAATQGGPLALVENSAVRRDDTHSPGDEQGPVCGCAKLERLLSLRWLGPDAARAQRTGGTAGDCRFDLVRRRRVHHHPGAPIGIEDLRQRADAVVGVVAKAGIPLDDDLFGRVFLHVLVTRAHGASSWAPVGSVLEPVHDRLGPVAVRAHLRGRALDVVCSPAKTDLSVLIDCPGCTWIAVERGTDTAGVHEQRSVRPRSTKLLVAVSEQDRSVRLAGEHPFFSRLWFRGEALDVGERGSVTDKDALQLSLLRKPVQPFDESGAE